MATIRIRGVANAAALRIAIRAAATTAVRSVGIATPEFVELRRRAVRKAAELAALPPGPNRSQSDAAKDTSLRYRAWLVTEARRLGVPADVAVRTLPLDGLDALGRQR